jgi:hypothetical protein
MYIDKLEKAKRRFYNSRINDVPYHLPFNEFILDCYLGYPPASYGKYLEKRIIMEIEKFGVSGIPSKLNQGDCKLYFNPKDVYDSTLIKSAEKGTHFRFYHPDLLKFALALNYEIKCSYLGQDGCYSIRNIKTYQNIDGGYIFCFIDCENDFTPEFYLVDFSVLERHFRMSHMNGVSSEHKGRVFKNMSITIAKGSDDYYVLKFYNKLGGTNLEDLISYFDKKSSEMKIQFYQNEEYQSELAEYRENHYKYVDSYVAEYRRLGRPL